MMRNALVQPTLSHLQRQPAAQRDDRGAEVHAREVGRTRASVERLIGSLQQQLDALGS